ncbi:MAG: hypothetical protein WCX70_00775 [Candidatus Paceibacterota bacterium]|jgi:hypothetical protein
MNTKKIIIFVALAAVLLLAVFWSVKMFIGQEESQGGVTLASGLPGGVNLLTGNITATDDPFIALLNGIKNIDLTNLKLLSDPIFKDKLRDLSRPVSDRGRGRENPFAQIGVGNLDLNTTNTQDLQEEGIFKEATTSEMIVPSEDETTNTEEDLGNNETTQ